VTVSTKGEHEEHEEHGGREAHRESRTSDLNAP
jgi:hypothetical protein